MRISRYCLLSLLPAIASAQGALGKNVQLDVRVSAVARHGDTTTVTYILTNRPTSTEALLAFTVYVPTVLEVTMPPGEEEWMTFTQFRNVTGPKWTILKDTRVPPGASTPPLTFRALGLPGIVDARVSGHYELPVYGDAGDAPEDDDPFLDHSSVIRVLGVVAPPPASTARDLTARLSTLVTEGCALG